MPSSRLDRRLAEVTPGAIVVAVDPHKASWSAVAVEGRLQRVEAVRVAWVRRSPTGRPRTASRLSKP